MSAQTAAEAQVNGGRILAVCHGGQLAALAEEWSAPVLRIPDGLTRQAFQLVLPRHDEEHPQESRRFGLVAEVVDECVWAIHTVRAEGDGLLAQLFDLTLFGDFVSLHLAAQEGLDPGPVPVLDFPEQALSTPA